MIKIVVDSTGLKKLVMDKAAMFQSLLADGAVLEVVTDEQPVTKQRRMKLTEPLPKHPHRKRTTLEPRGGLQALTLLAAIHLTSNDPNSTFTSLELLETMRRITTLLPKGVFAKRRRMGTFSTRRQLEAAGFFKRDRNDRISLKMRDAAVLRVSKYINMTAPGSLPNVNGLMKGMH